MKCLGFKSLRTRHQLVQVLIALLALPPVVRAQPPAPPQLQPIAPLPTVQSLRVIPLAGNGETNDLKRRIMAPLVVQVLDQNDNPVEGADVVFRFPLTGPSATFSNGRNSETARTNADGQAAAVGWTANDEVGTFQVRATASRGNEVGEATITMANATVVVDEGRKKEKRWWSSRWFKIAIVAGAATAVGVILATRGDNTDTITASPGSPTIGGPQ